MQVLVKHFINHPDPLVVPVSRFEIIENTQYNHRYSYDMEFLGMLSKEEKLFIDRVGDLHDQFGADALNQDYDLYPERHSLPRLFSYLKEVIALNRYHDLHAGNIMIDLDENYRIIDLEGFYYFSLYNSSNNWITR